MRSTVFRFHERDFMRLARCMLVPSLIAIALTGCSNSIIDIVPNRNQLDTLETIISPGIVMKLNGMRESYAPKDTVSGGIILANFDDTSTFKVNFPIWPGWSLQVFDQDGNFVGGGPEIVSFTDVQYDLAKGQSHFYDTFWSMQTFSKAKYGAKFLAFPGRYQLRFRLSGNARLNDKFLTKWITVQEADSFSCFGFKNSYEQYGYAVLDFAIRNRSSAPLTYAFAGAPKAEFAILDFPARHDTLAKQTVALNFNRIVIPSRSDSLLFSYRFDKLQPSLSNLHGTHIILLQIHFKCQEVSLADYIYFEPNAGVLPDG